MKLVSPLLKRVVYPCLSQAGFLQRPSTGRALSVVTYHGVRPASYRSLDPELDGCLVPAGAFRRQLRFFKTNYNVIHPVQFHNWLNGSVELPARALLLTCDDGLLNNLTDMLPVLTQEELSCLFFVGGQSLWPGRETLWHEQLYLMMLLSGDSAAIAQLTSLVGPQLGNNISRRSLWWSLVRSWSRFSAERRSEFLEVTRIRLALPDTWIADFFADSANQRRFGLLTQSELLALAAAGMEIGSHATSHPILSQMPNDIAADEITSSRLDLKRTLQKEVWAFAYPFGDPGSVGLREVELAERAGYRCAFLNCETSPTDSRFALPRLHITADISLAEIAAHLSGFHESIRRFARLERASSVGGRV